jgi:HEAT repeat protein
MKTIDSAEEVIRLIETPADDNSEIRRVLMETVRMSALVKAWRLAETPHSREILCEFYAMRLARSAHEELLEGLRDPEPAVRASAAHALGRLKMAESGEALYEALKSEESASPKRWMASAVGACGYEPASTHLISLLESDDPLLRTQSIWALGQLKTKAALEPLRRIDSSELTSWERHILDDALKAIA